jgi:D-sedoheptulose 7-phosphate isomerase
MAIDRAAMAAASIQECVAAQNRLLEEDCLRTIVDAARMVADSLARGGKLLLFGNGGSASDAAHVAAEFVGRFQRTRRALPALSLCTNQSAITAIANDFGFEHIFARQLEALGAPADVAIAISTSGRSANVIAGVQTARKLGIRTIGLTGGDGGELAATADICLRVPARSTARIQESHILLAHVLCELVECDLT